VSDIGAEGVVDWDVEAVPPMCSAARASSSGAVGISPCSFGKRF
jgi:hypothetical protein